MSADNPKMEAVSIAPRDESNIPCVSTMSRATLSPLSSRRYI